VAGLFLTVAACAAAVLVQQRWPRLLLPAFALTSVQWGEWLDGGQPVGEALLVLVGFGAVTIASGAGDAVRTASARLPRAAVALLAVNALVLSAAGLSAFDGALADGWVAALAGVHLAAGVAGGGRVTGTLRLVALALDAAVAYTTAVLLDGAWLAAAWSVLAAALLPLARAEREERGVGARVHRRNVLWPRAADRVAACGALGFLALGLCHVLAFEAPPVALIDGLDDALAAALALGALAAAATVLALARMVDPSTVLRAGVAPEAQATGRFAVHGVGILAGGLVRDVRVLRLAGLVLLGVTAAKVVAYDLATLTALYRVASLLALGLLLLVGAFLWQRVRPLQPH
jgi:hypothetical protein